MILLTAEDSSRLDQWALESAGLGGPVLMEAAGAVAALSIWLAWKKIKSRPPIVVVCGPGNNGGDGLGIVRNLLARGVAELRIFASPERKNGVAEQQALTTPIESLQDLIQVRAGKSHSSTRSPLKNAFVIDALFGVGLSRDLAPELCVLVEQMNHLAQFIVSVDTPSGLDANSGHVRGACVRANQTVTFGRPKIGFFLEQGPSHVGRMRIEPLVFNRALLAQIQPRLRLYQHKMARRDLPDRDVSGNKFSFGRVMVIAGREGAWGAGLMSASAALQSGAGYVTWAIVQESATTAIPPSVSLLQPELLTQTISVAEIKKWKSNQFAAVVVGPGLGRTDLVREVTEAVLSSGVPVLLDADVLSLFATQLPATLKRCRKLTDPPVILTPHEGELARLLGVTSETVQADRRAAAERLQRESHAVVVAKGFHTLVAGPDALSVIPSGNSALAKAGSGDVLSGIIAAMLALKLNAEKAACLGCYLHGLAADVWIHDGNSAHNLQPHQIPLLVQEITQLMFERLSPVDS